MGWERRGEAGLGRDEWIEEEGEEDLKEELNGREMETLEI